MTSEEKIKDLETRIEKLEKIERRRKIRNIIILCIYGVVVLTIVVSLIVLYNKLKPYKEKIDNLKSELKVDSIVDGSDNYDFFGGYPDYFDGFDDFFNGFFGY